MASEKSDGQPVHLITHSMVRGSRGASSPSWSSPPLETGAVASRDISTLK
jgi:hypothetical protein